MRRCFAIFLLALLPFQFSWAALAVYCGHENDVQAQHVGHHGHGHADGASVDSPADVPGLDAPPTGTDPDCGQCHSNCCSMPALAGSPVLAACVSHPALAADGAQRTRAQAPPERPQWLRLA